MKILNICLLVLALAFSNVAFAVVGLGSCPISIQTVTLGNGVKIKKILIVEGQKDSTGEIVIVRRNQDRSADKSFGKEILGGRTGIDIGPADSYVVNYLTTQADGRFVVAGTKRTTEGTSLWFRRYTVDGASIDSSFNSGKEVVLFSSSAKDVSAYVSSIAFSSNSIVILGFTAGSPFVALYNMSGTALANTAFPNSSVKFNGAYLEKNSRIFVAGTSKYDGDGALLAEYSYRDAVSGLQLNTESFNPKAGYNVLKPTVGKNIKIKDLDIRAVTIQKNPNKVALGKKDYKVLVAGVIDLKNMGQRAVVIQFDQNGAVDYRFGLNTLNNLTQAVTVVGVSTTDDSAWREVALSRLFTDDSGRIYVTGTYRAAGTSNHKPFVARLYNDGKLDPTFGEKGILMSNSIGIYALPQVDSEMEGKGFTIVASVCRAETTDIISWSANNSK